MYKACMLTTHAKNACNPFLHAELLQKNYCCFIMCSAVIISILRFVFLLFHVIVYSILPYTKALPTPIHNTIDFKSNGDTHKAYKQYIIPINEHQFQIIHCSLYNFILLSFC